MTVKFKFLNNRKLLLESTFLFDEKTGLFTNTKTDVNKPDSFTTVINKELEGRNIKLQLPTDTKLGFITADNITILEFDNLGRLITVNLPNTIKIPNNFLRYNQHIKNFTADNCKEIGDHFFCNNKSIQELNLPSVEIIGYDFLCENENLVTFTADKCKKIGVSFLCGNNAIQELNLPSVEVIGNDFLYENENLVTFTADNCKKIGTDFLCNNNAIQKLNLPSVEVIGSNFLYENKNLVTFTADNCKEIDDFFLYNNKSMPKLNLPSVEVIGNYFLYGNENLVTFTADNCKEIGDSFLCGNNAIQELNLPSVKVIENGFLYKNENLVTFTADKCKKIGGSFLCSNNTIQELNLPSVEVIGNDFLYKNENLVTFTADNCKEIGDSFLHSNKAIQELNLPSVKIIGDDFLCNNKSIQELNLPSVEVIGNYFLYENKKLVTFTADNCKKIGNYFLYNNDSMRELYLSNLDPIYKSNINKTTQENEMSSSKNNINFTAPMRLQEQIEFYINNGMSFMLHGPSGIGKSARIEEIDPNFTAISLWNGVLPEDIVGKVIYPDGSYAPLTYGNQNGNLPEQFVRNGVWVEPDWYSELVKKCKSEPEKNHVLFIDEVTNAKPTTQSLIFHIVLKKSISPSKGKLPDNSVVVLAGNNKEESNAAYNMPSPLFRRMSGHIYLKPDLNDWLEWAGRTSNKSKDRRNIHPLISSFLASNPQAFYSNYDEEEPKEWAIDPRGWEQISDIIYASKGILKRELLINKIGKQNTEALIKFSQLQILSLEDVLTNNFEQNDIPKQYSEKLALTMSLNQVSERDVNKVRSFIKDNLGNEFLAIFDYNWTKGNAERAIILSKYKTK